jgi:hypothetical protein
MKGKSAIVIFGVVSVVILFFVLGSTFSDQIIEVKIKKMYANSSLRDSLNSPHFWNKWVWNFDDPSSKVEYFKVESGKGAGLVRKSGRSGKSGFKILASNSDSLTYELVTDDQRFVEKGVFYFKSSEDSTQLIWKNEIDFTRNILARYKSYWTDYSKVFESYQTLQLENLDSLLNEKVNE